MDDAAEALLALVAAEPGVSTAKACKRLGLSRSELQRWLTFGGMQFVRVEDDGERQTLWPAERAP
jgi:DNA-binding IclR family transcriptional regulator